MGVTGGAATRDEGPGWTLGGKSRQLALGQWAGAAEGSWLRGSQGSWWPLCPLTTACCVPDGLHPGAAADADGGQAEAVSGQPAANHAESDTMIGEQESGAQLIWGEEGPAGLMLWDSGESSGLGSAGITSTRARRPALRAPSCHLEALAWRREARRTCTPSHVKPLAAVES